MFYSIDKKNNATTALFKICLILSSALVISGCVNHTYVSEPVDTQQNYTDILLKQHDSQEFRQFLDQHQYTIKSWPITLWDLKALTLAAVYFNPEINVILAEVEVEKAGEIIATQRPNPSVNLPLENYSPSGDSPWFTGLVFDFLFERKEKRIAKAERAKAERLAIEIKLQNKIWTIYSNLHSNLIEYFFAIKQKEMLLNQRALLKENLVLLNRRKELGQVSQFELSRVRLEQQQLQLQLANQNYLINDAFHNLIAITGLLANKFNQTSIQFDSIQESLAAQLPDEIQLRKELLNNRFDIKRKLKEYEAFEASLKLEIAKQYPDLNLSPGFIFDQGQNVWSITASWVLPVFHNHEGEIEQALAKRKQMQAELIVMQTNLINDLNRKHQNYTDIIASYENSLALLRELEGRSNQIQKQFDLGYADQLSLIQVKLELEKAKQAVLAIKVGVLRAVKELERITQVPIHDDGVVKQVIQKL